MLPPAALSDQPTSSITGHCIERKHLKVPHPVFCVAWTPDGRRLISGDSNGDVATWNGTAFNFTTITSIGRQDAVRAFCWSHMGDYLLLGDHTGKIVYYQPTMNALHSTQSHNKPIRGVSFAPTDSKFVTCSDDATLVIWDFASHLSEVVLQGHNWDVRTVEWHPYNSLIVSGAKDKLIKLWDAKSRTNVHTWQGHKGDVTKVTWNQNGNWFLSSSRDYSMHLFDIRTMKELQVFKGQSEITSIAWHPYHEKLFSSGDNLGDVNFWLAGQDEAQGKLIKAHDSAIWDMKWHPFGHVLCTGSNDTYVGFWSRNRPGDKMEDKYNNPNWVPTARENENIRKPEFAMEEAATTTKQLAIPGAVGSDVIEDSVSAGIPGLGLALASQGGLSFGRNAPSSASSAGSSGYGSGGSRGGPGAPGGRPGGDQKQHFRARTDTRRDARDSTRSFSDSNYDSRGSGSSGRDSYESRGGDRRDNYDNPTFQDANVSSSSRRDHGDSRGSFNRGSVGGNYNAPPSSSSNNSMKAEWSESYANIAFGFPPPPQFPVGHSNMPPTSSSSSGYGSTPPGPPPFGFPPIPPGGQLPPGFMPPNMYPPPPGGMGMPPPPQSYHNYGPLPSNQQPPYGGGGGNRQRGSSGGYRN